MESHIRAFHSITGTTHFEISKNFSTFERSLNDETFNPELFFSALETKNAREEFLKIKLLRKFNRHEDSLKILIKGPAIFSKFILRNPKLIQHIGTYSGEDLIRDIFEEVSFKIRARLINKLAFQIENEDKGLEFYKATLDKYGLKVAKPLLIACAGDVIIKAIEQDEVEFRHAELFNCYKKSNRSLEVYFKKNLNFHLYPKLGQFLCINDVELFHSLTKYGFPKIGRTALIKYLSVHKKEFIENAKNTKATLSNKFKWRCLSEEEMAVWYKTLLPKSLSEFGWDYPSYCEMLPLKSRGKVLFQTFREKYGFDIWDFKEYEVAPMLEVLALEDRRKFDLAELVQFESTEKAIPILENQLQFTNQPHKRASIMTLILKNCKYNNDYDALLRVLKKFAERQKNEMKTVRFSVIQDIVEYFKFRKFTEEHWECIDKIILQCHMNDEYSYPLDGIVLELIKYKISKGLDYDFYLKILFKTIGTYYFPTFSIKPEHERKVLLKSRSIMHEITVNDIKYSHTTFIASVVKFNHKNRKNKNLQIPLGEYKDSLKIVAEDIKLQYPNFHEVENLLKSLRNEKDNDEILEALLLSSFTKGNGFAQTWFLNMKPYLIEKHIEVLFKTSKFHKKFDYALLKLESPLKAKILNHAIEVVKNPQGKESAEICSSITLLSSSRDFDLDAHTKIWIPTEVKIDAQKEGTKDLFDIQKTLIKTYKNRHNLKKVIPDILNFCRGDYLKFGLEPLYYLSTNIPEKDLISPLQELASRSVSARKHVLYLVTYSSSLDVKRKFLKQFADVEKNSSVKKVILQSLCKCLKDDRTEDDWTFFSSHLHFIDPEDKEIDQLVYGKNFPKKYYTKFILLMWNQLSQRGKHEEFKLLESLDYKKFVFENCSKDIIKRSLFNTENKLVDETNTFIFYYLLDASKESEALKNQLEFIWECIQENSKTWKPYEFQKTLHEFFAYFCKKILQQQDQEDDHKVYEDKDVLKIIETMNNLIPELNIPNRNFLLSLLLKTTILYTTIVTVSSRNTEKPTDIKTFPKSILEEIKSLIESHGLFIIKIYSKLIVEFLKLVDDEKVVIDLIEGVFNCDNSKEVRAFCVGLLPEKVPKNTTLRDQYFKLLKQLGDDCYIIGLDIDAHVLNVSF